MYVSVPCLDTWPSDLVVYLATNRNNHRPHKSTKKTECTHSRCFTMFRGPHKEIAPGVGVPFEPPRPGAAVELSVVVGTLLLGRPEHTRLLVTTAQYLLGCREHRPPLTAQGLGDLTMVTMATIEIPTSTGISHVVLWS